jgi:hypothetical protein
MSHRRAARRGLTFKPVTSDVWPDFETLFEEPGIQDSRVVEERRARPGHACHRQLEARRGSGRQSGVLMLTALSIRDIISINKPTVGLI